VTHASGTYKSIQIPDICPFVSAVFWDSATELFTESEVLLPVPQLLDSTSNNSSVPHHLFFTVGKTTSVPVLSSDFWYLSVHSYLRWIEAGRHAIPLHHLAICTERFS
jgi:hypothetical protein